MKKKFDFSGYATKVNLKCSDGRTILKNAFKDDDGIQVPLVWQHIHNDPGNVLGHAILENREDGVYAYCAVNNTPAAQNAKELVEHGDITALSIHGA
jgi:HK97 family phage prohead protease